MLQVSAMMVVVIGHIYFFFIVKAVVKIAEETKV